MYIFPTLTNRASVNLSIQAFTIFTTGYNPDPRFYYRELAMLFARSSATGLTTMITSSTGYPTLEEHNSGMPKTKILGSPRSAVSLLDALQYLTAVSLRLYTSSIVPESFARMIVLVVRTLSHIQRMCTALWGRKNIDHYTMVVKSRQSVTTWSPIL